MKRTQKQAIAQTEEFLDERWLIANMKIARPVDIAYYNGACKALEFVGFTWERDTEGKHRVYKE